MHPVWGEAKWSELIGAVKTRRRYRRRAENIVRVGELMYELRSLDTVGPMLSSDELHDLAWQVKHFFQDRNFNAPPNILTPFEEPTLELQVGKMATDLRYLVEPIRALVNEMHEEVVMKPRTKTANERLVKQASFASALLSKAAKPRDAKTEESPSVEPADAAAPTKSASPPASSTPSAVSLDMSTQPSAQQLWELVLQQQQTIAEQQQALARLEAKMP